MPGLPAPAADLQRLAGALRDLARRRTNSLDYHMQVAELVVDEIYGGRLEALRSEATEGPSFNDLARDLGGVIKKTTLHRALWAYEVRKTTPVYVIPDAVHTDEGVPTLEHVAADELERLGASHFYEVRALAIPLRSELLSRAVHSRWSVRRLRREIQARTGTPAANPSRVPSVLDLLLRLDELPATVDLTPLAALSEADAVRYQSITQKVHDLTICVQEALAKRLPAQEQKMRYSRWRMRA